MRVLAGAFAAIALAGQAAAAVQITTYRGTVAAGATDETGVFGPIGSLAGASFIAVFQTDTSAPGANTGFNATSSFIEGVGPTPPVTGWLIINGVTLDFLTEYGAQQQSDNGELEFFSHYASSGVGSLYAGGSGTGLDFLPGPDFRTFGSAELSLVPSFSGFFSIFEGDPETGEDIRVAHGNLNITSVSVPEPQAWLLMILGFMSAGAAIRYRRQVAVRSSQ